jgi:hypothetical protein
MVTGEVFNPRSKLAGYSTEIKMEHRLSLMKLFFILTLQLHSVIRPGN